MIERARDQFFRPGELPVVLLALLSERPRGSYDLMGELRRRFRPRYRASPGAIYPAIAALREEGLIEGDSGLGRGVHRITELGRGALGARGAVLAEVELRTSVEVAPGASLQPLLDRFAARVGRHTGRVDRGSVERILDQAASAIAKLEGSDGHVGRGIG